VKSRRQTAWIMAGLINVLKLSVMYVCCTIDVYCTFIYNMCPTCLMLRNSALCHTLYLCVFFPMRNDFTLDIEYFVSSALSIGHGVCSLWCKKWSFMHYWYEGQHSKLAKYNPFRTFHVCFFSGCEVACLLELRPLMDLLYTCWLIDKWIWSFGGMMIDKMKVKRINKSLLLSLCEKLSRETGAETDPSRWLTTWAVARFLFSFVMEHRR
jgi:hypothetical protein